MTIFIDTIRDPRDQVTNFVDVVRGARPGEKIIYHVGPHCMMSPLRRWALGAYESGMVLLAKERVSAYNYNHCAIRTKRKFQHFVPAVDIK